MAPLPTAETATPDAPSGTSPIPNVPGDSGPSRKRRHGVPPIFRFLFFIALIGGGAWLLFTNGFLRPSLFLTSPRASALTASGSLEADEMLVGPEIAGRLVQLSAEGETVRGGDVVARLDDSLIQLQIRQADTPTQQQLYNQAQRYQLLAPTDGVVTRVPMHVGEVVSPGQTVVALADLSILKLTAYVLERDIGQVQVGQKVNVTADPFPSQVFSGEVTSTNPRAEFTPRNVQTQADRLNLVFGVKIRVDNPSRALKPGMPADATFTAY